MIIWAWFVILCSSHCSFWCLKRALLLVPPANSGQLIPTNMPGRLNQQNQSFHDSLQSYISLGELKSGIACQFHSSVLHCWFMTEVSAGMLETAGVTIQACHLDVVVHSCLAGQAALRISSTKNCSESFFSVANLVKSWLFEHGLSYFVALIAVFGAWNAHCCLSRRPIVDNWSRLTCLDG